LGDVLFLSKRLTEAEEQYQTALAEFKKLREDYSRNPRYLEYSFDLWYSTATVRRQADDHKGAEVAYREANAIARLLRSDFPERAEALRAPIVSMLGDYSGLYATMGRPVKTAEILSQMLEWEPKKPKK